MRATGGRRLNAHLRRTFYLLAMGFVALVGVLAYWQVYMRESLVNNPANALQSQRARETPRGLILAGDGETVLARSERVGEESYRRVYPEGEVFANVVGYWSSRFGANGIEIGQNNNLSSTDEPETLDELINQVTGGREAGNNVTFDPGPRAAASAYEELANSNTGRGSVMGARSADGEILAMATYPSFDPNNIDEETARSCPRTRMRRSSTARPSPCTRRARRSRS
jgi:peptidoglycan glycosyltransferase